MGGDTCDLCKGLNHFKVVCSKSVHGVRQESDSDSDSSYDSISSVTMEVHTLSSPRNNPILCKMLLNKRPVKMQVDCGTNVSVLPKKYVAAEDIRPESVTLKMWNNVTTKALGRCCVKTINPATGGKYKVDFVVVDQDGLAPLLSRKAAEMMNLITVNYDNMTSNVYSVAQSEHAEAPHMSLVKDYAEVFNSQLGSLPGGKVHLTVELNTHPVVRPPRTLPESLNATVRDELDRLEQSGVIVKVDKPTDWVNQMSVAKKRSGAVRICIDPRPLNLALKREHYKLPVLDDIQPKLVNSKKFAICDLQQGYLHCELDDESSLLNTFATPFGRYRSRPLPFGLKVSSEIFQKRLQQALEGLENVHAVADDIIIHGSDENDLHAKMQKLLERCKSHGIRLNRDKFRFNVKEIQFLGHVVTSDGLKPDPSKIEAVLKMEEPHDKEAVESLRGTVTYLARYVPKLTDVFRPISALAQRDVEWMWGDAQVKAFTELKQLLTQAPTLAFFDPSKQLAIQCDASNHGLGSALLQDGRPIAYASRALTDTETWYAIIEKEMLAIVFALERWHQFTFGRPVIVYSDHKPLEAITKKPLHIAPKRLQGMLLRALAYNIDVHYLEGKKMFLADTLSRAFLPADEKQVDSEFEAVHAVTYLPMREDVIHNIRTATSEDTTLLELKSVIQHGWPARENVPLLAVPYFNFRDELAVADGLIFRGERLVIPQTERSRIKKDIHIGHVGIEGCLRRARESVYWPGMNAEIKEWIQTCETCREYERSQPKESLMSHDVPDRPWQKVGVDLFSYEDKDYMVTTDYR